MVALDDRKRSLLRLGDPHEEVTHLESFSWADFHSGDVDWEGDGLLIGQYGHLEQLGFEDLEQPNNTDTVESEEVKALANFRAFCKGVARSRAIKELYLDGFGSDAIFSTLSPVFEGNNTFCKLCVYQGGLDSESVADQFASAIEKWRYLREIELIETTDESPCEGRTISALKSCKNLRKLTIDGCRSIPNDCAELADVLNNTPLEELIVKEFTDINDQGVARLGGALQTNTTLKALTLETLSSVTFMGWRAFFTSLQSPECALENLRVYMSVECSEDEEAESIATALANTRLRSFDLGSAIFSPNGWRSFFTNLLQSNSLEHLNASFGVAYVDDDEIIDDGIASAIANALGNNTTLKSLNLPHLDYLSGDGVRAVFSSIEELLCNTKSLRAAAASSNHSLSNLSCSAADHHTEVPNDLVALLQLNQSDNKAERVRQKILRYYKTDHSDVDELVDLEWTEVMPHAFAWAGRDAADCNLLYRLIRRVPSLFSSARGTVVGKRKRGK
ncbi:hypothetical protein ACHAXT_008317 [Thalassiosira profunda]